jgi:hypothetical protein
LVYWLEGAVEVIDQNKYLIRLSETLCPLVWDGPLSALSPAEQVFVCVYDMEREVNNGGFAQFFTNAPGQYTTETVQALETIGARSMADIVRTAAAILFPDGKVPVDQDERLAILEAAGERVGKDLLELDDRFCQYPDDLAALLFGYIQCHRSSVRGTGDA